MYLQSVLGLDVLTAVLLAVPGTLVLTVTCVVTPRFLPRAAAADSAREAFLRGLHAAVAVGSAVSFAVGLLILRLLPRTVR
ncbi:hypothetical protein ACWFMI_10460 [Nocardiopsis terrae]